MNDVSSMIWEQLNRFWAESYEACKASSQKRAKFSMESRRKFQVSYFCTIPIEVINAGGNALNTNVM